MPSVPGVRSPTLSDRLLPSGHDFRVLAWPAVLAITFLNVSGGPFGSEEIVSAGGPFWGFISIWVLAVMWSFPVACMTAELSTAFPDDGGYSLWVQQAFGDFWGFQESYWSWISGVTDNAVYSVLVYDSCVSYVWKSPISHWSAYLIKLGLVFLFSIPNLLSVKLAGHVLVVMMGIVILPFVILMIVSIPDVDPHHWFEHVPFAKVDWHLLLTTTFWNISGFDCASTFAGEVKTPGRTYPRAMMGALVAVVLMYTLALGASVGVNKPDWREWSDGSFTTIADNTAGPWLGWMLVACSVVSNLAMHVAELFEDSFQLMGMAQANMMPRYFAKRSRLGTPARAIVLSVILISFLIMFDFSSILVIQNFLYSLAVCLEILACVHLRLKRPDLKRPPHRWVILPLPIFIIPFIISAGMLVVSLTSSIQTTCVNIGGALLGIVLYYLFHKLGLSRKRAISSVSIRVGADEVESTFEDGQFYAVTEIGDEDSSNNSGKDEFA